MTFGLRIIIFNILHILFRFSQRLLFLDLWASSIVLITIEIIIFVQNKILEQILYNISVQVLNESLVYYVGKKVCKIIRKLSRYKVSLKNYIAFS